MKKYMGDDMVSKQLIKMVYAKMVTVPSFTANSSEFPEFAEKKNLDPIHPGYRAVVRDSDRILIITAYRFWDAVKITVSDETESFKITIDYKGFVISNESSTFPDKILARRGYKSMVAQASYSLILFRDQFQ